MVRIVGRAPAVIERVTVMVRISRHTGITDFVVTRAVSATTELVVYIYIRFVAYNVHKMHALEYCVVGMDACSDDDDDDDDDDGDGGGGDGCCRVRASTDVQRRVSARESSSRRRLQAAAEPSQ